METITAWCRLAHCLLAHDRPLVFALYHLDEFIVRFPDVLRSMYRLWELKLAPLSKSSLSSRYPIVAEDTTQVQRLIESKIESEDCRVFYLTMLAVIVNTLKTNAFLPNRMGIAIRLDPVILRDKLILRGDRSVSDFPSAIIFIHGRELTGFYVRFSDIARGGLRLTVSHSMEQYAALCRSLLFDCLGLAKAQVLKNKDIPESGAKAMILQDFHRSSPNRPSIGPFKAFIDGMLDMVCVKRGHPFASYMVDYAGDEDLVYLGPDEHITTTMIEWAYRRAVARGHSFPAAFFSSKVATGISHSEFAVTAEGASVFLEVYLRHYGIDWLHGEGCTIKLMGSPAHPDVGGLIRVLCRDFGPKLRFIAIADETGFAEDPKGLSHTELARLIQNKLPIVDFKKDQLSQLGNIVDVHDPSGAGMKARNSLPYRLKSTVFIPALQRPGFINENNWKQFFGDNGQPASPIVLEYDGSFVSLLNSGRCDQLCVDFSRGERTSVKERSVYRQRLQRHQMRSDKLVV
jgi:glutamate dehydrogenase